MKRISSQPGNLMANRRGTLQPAIAVALLAVGAAMALVLNSLWKDAAVVELRSAAEAAALAAAGEYLNEARLDPRTDEETLAAMARQKAAVVAKANRVAGQPVQLNAAFAGDIVFGRRVDTPEYGPTFLQTDQGANAVEVRAARTRAFGNPLPFFLGGVTGQSTGDAIVSVEASFDNTIDHFRPVAGMPVPALPLAILAADPAGERIDTWQQRIVQRGGTDNFRFDAETRRVIAEPDGIPEMELNGVPLNTPASEANVVLLDLANGLDEMQINQQIIDGLNADDLQEWNGILPAQQPFNLAGMATITTPVQLAFEEMIGQQRICLLYGAQENLRVPGWAMVTCQGAVAIRILQVIPEANERATIVIQPTILTTRTAALAQFQSVEDEQQNNSWNTAAQRPQTYTPNPYIYKVYLNK
ncbi:hypothetical protein [Rubinisphaera brasiliensis]|uniref:Uncharacterized protein n=1 Tax=Rubinisphaera brasiliensis (strain ATCC 49424 / DSM 5305 / JCM 21570 / IAM 15109 / NBRC 103401 / IFAM 1448) TaxID=756272 RepID=F0SQ83_RUBBR|nr:hypothetical protein [Rubinisphaera brasiliensis]ADY62262.1 hypothetical protein Plabr_4691 [Rubinisphaera brasiliensis DSM 5305]